MIKRIQLLFLIFTLFLLTACENDGVYSPTYQKEKIKHKTVYIFGIHPLHNPKRLFEVYEPLVEYLNQHLDNVEIKLESSRNYDAYNKKLYSRKFDFALPNPYQTIKSLEYGYKIFGKMADDEEFRGIILVRKDSNIKEFKDLKGKKISYPAPTALAATMLPQYFLYEHGININKDVENIYVGSQESSIMNVYLKNVDAAATWIPPWEAFIKERPEVSDEVKIIWETMSLPNNGLVVRNDIPKELVDKVSKLIFELPLSQEGLDLLKQMNLSHFEKADESTYKVVKDFLVKFERDVRSIK